MLSRDADDVCREAGIPLLLASSVKAGLDQQWVHQADKARALEVVVEQVEALQRWVQANLAASLDHPPLQEHLKTLHQVLQQDLEPEPDASGRRLRQGTAKGRRISIEDEEMRHGRKSSSKRFDGYKRHIAKDIDEDIVLACAVTPANRPEAEATEPLQRDIEAQGLHITEVLIDRGYMDSSIVHQILDNGGDVICRPWKQSNGELFSKENFQIDLDAQTVTCPAGFIEAASAGKIAHFNPANCASCALRASCTSAAEGRGRSLRIAHDERLQQQLRERSATPEGRSKLRERVAVEHGLAHLGQKQGRRARYRGVRRNLYDVRRAASINNLELAHRMAA